MAGKRGLGRHSAIGAVLARPKTKAKASGREPVQVAAEVAVRLRECAYFERKTLFELANTAILAEVARREAARREADPEFVYPPRPSRR